MSNTQNISAFVQKLRKISQSPNDSLEKAVAIEALDRETPEYIQCFVGDLFTTWLYF